MASRGNSVQETRDALIMLVVHRQTQSGCPVGARDVIDIAWNGGRGLSYDQTNRVLKRLVRNGRLTKPTRGMYLPMAGDGE